MDSIAQETHQKKGGKRTFCLAPTPDVSKGWKKGHGSHPKSQKYWALNGFKGYDISQFFLRHDFVSKVASGTQVASQLVSAHIMSISSLRASGSENSKQPTKLHQPKGRWSPGRHRPWPSAAARAIPSCWASRPRPHSWPRPQCFGSSPAPSLGLPEATANAARCCWAKACEMGRLVVGRPTTCKLCELLRSTWPNFLGNLPTLGLRGGHSGIITHSLEKLQLCLETRPRNIRMKLKCPTTKNTAMSLSCYSLVHTLKPNDHLMQHTDAYSIYYYRTTINAQSCCIVHWEIVLWPNYFMQWYR